MTPFAFAKLFPEFRAASWSAWRGILRQLTPKVRELYVVAGRGSGKSRIIALLACAYATRRYRQAPGEEITIGVAAPDRKQARITFRYIVALLRSDASLAALIVRETKERLVLQGDIVLEVISATKSAPRGRSYGCFIIEEASMLPSDETSSEPDIELVRAIGPALARVPGSLLCVIGSPYARRGLLYEAFVQGNAPDRLVIAHDTLTLNPTFRRAEIERAFQRDPISAASEYGDPRTGTIQFRPDVSGLLADDAIAAVVAAGVRELAPNGAVEALAHFDAATGSGDDAAALAIAFRGKPVALACVRQWRPPFSPSQVIAEASALLTNYGVTAITIDRFAPGLIVDLFRERSIVATVAALDTSAAFVDVLALINSQRVVLLDDPTLLGELRRLERRPTSGGRDAVSHPARGHDDVAAATAQALIAAARTAPIKTAGVWGAARTSQPPPQAEREIIGQQFRGGRWVPLYRDETQPIPAHATVQRR